MKLCLVSRSTQKVDVTNETNEDLDQPSAAMIQMVEFKGNGEEKITKECIRKLGGTKLKKVVKMYKLICLK